MKKIIKYFDIISFHSAYDYKWDNGFIFTGESHDFWEAVFVASGKAQITENTNIYNLTENEMIFHAPREFHSIKSAENTPTNVLIISFSIEGMPPQNLSEGPFYLSHEEMHSYKQVFSKVYNFYNNENNDIYDGLECANLLSQFLIKLNQNKSSRNSLICSQTAKVYNNIVATMTEHVYDNCTLEDIAKKCNISVSYIKLLFKQFLGVSPKRYYAELRCNEAIRLLKIGLSGAEISDKMCFSSQGYFSTFLKKYTGLPPSKLQKCLSHDKHISSE